MQHRIVTRLKNRKYPSELGTRVIRIPQKDWDIVAEYACNKAISLGDATHELLEKGFQVPDNQPCNKAMMSNAPSTDRPTGVPLIPGLVVEGNKIIGVAPKAAATMANPPLDPLPLYNPMVHKPGDKVMVYQEKRLVSVVVPEVDADGHSIPWV